MIPLLVFLLACAGGLSSAPIEAAFSALMRLSLRLVAERNGRDSPARPVPRRSAVCSSCRSGSCSRSAAVLITALLARSIGAGARRIRGADGPRGRGAPVRRLRAAPAAADRPARSGAGARGAAAVVRRRSPGRCTRSPSLLVASAHSAASARSAGRGRRRPPRSSDEAAEAYIEAAEQEGLIEGDERRLLQIIVDFGDTLVREVMTPRPDIVAHSRRRDDRRSPGAVSRAGVLRGFRSTRRASTTSPASSS